ncbi:MAG: hypothetical protein ACI9Y1_002599 [Lentisphaeria bacterium]|jgi:hypothetical protein
MKTRARVAIFLLVCVVLSTAQVHAGKLYKTVDEKGDVSFSQIPPAAGQGNESVEELTLKNENDAMSRVTNELGNEYCGEIQLPSQNDYRSTSSSVAKKIIYQEKTWKNSLKRLSDSIQRRNQSKFNANRSYNSTYQSQRNAQAEPQLLQDLQQIRDLRCAVNWAKTQREEVTTIANAEQNEKTRLTDIYRKLELELDQTCGRQPLFDPTDKLNERNRKDWFVCSKDLMRDLKKVRVRLEAL